MAEKRGVYRDFKTLMLPTFVEELYVGCGTSSTIAFNTTTKGRSTSSHGVVDGKTVYYLKGLEGTPIGSVENGTDAEFNAQQLQWKPDFDFADHTKLITGREDANRDYELLERLFVLCAVESKRNVAGV